MAGASTTTQYLHKECGAPIVWAKDGGKCTGAGCEATGLIVADCGSIRVPLPRPEKATAPSRAGEVPLFEIEEIPGLAGDREAQ